MKHLVLFLSLLLVGCVQDPELVSPVIPIPSAKGVYIVNEGNWGRGNATLTHYDLSTFSATPDVFAPVNGRGLGDVGNDMEIHGSRGYIVVNGSDRIEVISLETHGSLLSVSTGAGSSPRQIAFWGDSLALVTSLYQDALLLFRLPGMEPEGRISVGPNPEGVAVTNDKAYVANSGFGSGKTVSVVDLRTRSVRTTIAVGENPAGVALGGDGRVYVVCGGAYNDYSDPADDTPASLAVIDPATDLLAATIPLGEHASRIALTPEGRGYIPLSTKVVTIDTWAKRVVGTFLEGSFYGIGVDEVSGDVYLTDPKNYTQTGEVLVYAPNGQFRTSFSAGIIPGAIAFKR